MDSGIKPRVLLVEDDPNLGFVIKDNLQLKGYDVSWHRSGVEGQLATLGAEFDICVLDIMLPGKDGFSVAKELREMDTEIPIIFITARSLTEDKLNGFRVGGDDYITKPFHFDELFYRIEVFLRRSQNSNRSGPALIGQYAFDAENLTLTHASGNKTLTSKEAQLLKVLYSNRHRIVKRTELLKRLWGNDDYFSGRSMDVFISKLRKYLKHDPSVRIMNYHGIGFKLAIGGQE